MGARGTVTPLAVAVLALLDERPRHPYDMHQALLERGMDRLVKVRPGSLYHTVARLTGCELIRADGVDRDGRRPERTTYRITSAGRAALRDRVAELLRTPAAEYPGFPLALAEAHNLPKEQVRELLAERRAQLGGDLDEIRALGVWAGDHALPRRYWMVLTYLRTMLEAEIGWVDALLGDLDDGTLAWDRFDPGTGRRIAAPIDAWATAVRADPPPLPAEPGATPRTRSS
ncbi:PadR family transcriptional regulator [Nocardia jiangsuensis]|uniref:PadR family transcriptional regulator n=1 Tax=Nocardia jiangsuensis TaxID=1691563 RepID=A0ABV8DXG2_9NOCA